MASIVVRSALCVGLLTGAVLAVSAEPTGAAPPSALGFATTAPRTYGDGGPAALTPVTAQAVTTTPEGAVLFYDAEAHQIRRVEPVTKTITKVAGSGVGATGAMDTTHPGTDINLPRLNALWTDAAGEIFASVCGGPNCAADRDLYRLDAADGLWHVVVHNLTPLGVMRFDGFAVASDGTVYAADVNHLVIRRFAVGADPNSAGAIVAGTLDTAGSTGDGGPATSATLTPGGAIAVAPSGDVLFSDGPFRHDVRRIATDGTITTVGDSGISSTPSSSSVLALATSADSAHVYVLRGPSVGDAQIRAVAIDGSNAHTVAGPLPQCNTGTENCLGTSLAEITDNSVTSILDAWSGAIGEWPSDGSAPTGYQRYAGILDDVKGLRSPDGAHLDETYLSPIRAIAVAPSGAVALATDDGVRTLTGLDASDTLGTAIPHLAAQALSYADDGTLYAAVPLPSQRPELVALSGGVVQTVLGGGSDPVTDGANGTDVQLDYSATTAVDPSDGTVYFTTSANELWRLDRRTGQLHPVAPLGSFGTGVAGLAVAADHSVFAGVTGYHDQLVRVDADGSATLPDCAAGCPTHRLRFVSDGSLIGEDSSNVTEVRAATGTVRRLSVGVPFGTTPDDRIVAVGRNAWGPGLLGISDPIAAPGDRDVPIVQVSAAPGGVTVDITPAAVSEQHITIAVGVMDDRRVWKNGTFGVFEATTDGSGKPIHHTFSRLVHTWPDAPGSVTVPPYTVQVVAREGFTPGTDEIVDAPVTAQTTPLTDAIPPGAPGLALSGGPVRYLLQVAPPADPDVDLVIVCKTTDGTVPAAPSPQTCDGVTGGPIEVSADSMQTTNFTAFAVDLSGNVSPSTHVTRPAAILTTGTAATGVGFQAENGSLYLTWTGSNPARVQYAPGTTPPDGPFDGLPSPSAGTDGQHQFATIPVTSGQKVSTSIFTWTDSQQTKYRRTSFVLTAGTNSDSASLVATRDVEWGTAPTVRLTLVRHTALGATTGLGGRTVTLYRRATNTTAWTVVQSLQTSSSGVARFTVPTPNRSTQYAARWPQIDQTTRTTGIVQTTVHQTVAATFPATARVGRTIAVTGRIAPRRAVYVTLQRYDGGRWLNVAKSRASGTTGQFRCSLVPRQRGRWILRVSVPRSATLAAIVSGAHGVTIG